MAKILLDEEGLEIISDTINGTLIDDADTYKRFLKDISSVVADYFGGRVGSCDEEYGQYYCAFHLTEEVPDNGGVYRNYDTDVVWRNGKEKEK